MTDYDSAQRLMERQRMEARLADLLDQLVDIVPAYPVKDLPGNVRARMRNPHMLDEVSNLANAIRQSAPPPVSLSARRGSPDAWPRPPRGAA